MGEKRGLRHTISRWASSDHAEARDLRRDYGRERVCIADAPDRTPVTLKGVVRTITLRPRGGVPALEAELYDGSGVLVLVWLGRRRIAGVDPGRSLQVSGRIGQHEGVRMLYNPKYELLS